MDTQTHATIARWYAANARDLPWRRSGTTPWGILVSEFMCQQTPAERVAPQWEAWMARWPTPRDLAAESPAEVIRAWGRLGYPRRALRLREAAVAIADRHDGEVPDDEATLLALPGVGPYTAAAILAFAFQRSSVVLDTNVRRVIARAFRGEATYAASLGKAESEFARSLIPEGHSACAAWSAGLMELGARICRAASPECEACPLAGQCRWLGLGKPAYDGPRRPAQRFEGTDRQARGRIMAVLREAHGPVAASAIEAAWPDAVQRARALDGLVADGLVEVHDGGRLSLPA